MQPPTYFNNIQHRASERWDQLERDPELAGPWHQLFRQVQSPRHVLSELLQNADDAGAKSAWVRIEGEVFIFEHDGDDFDQNQFASLCRFGFSNKRNLHTIGFRGVGFKSTFSLGDTVEVLTPTLSVCFKKRRFTQPLWLNESKAQQRTIIQVRITDPNCVAQLRKNFEEWTRSPASLLFFNSLKELSIDGQNIRRQLLKEGPVPDSAWIKLGTGTDAQKLLVIQSEAIPFPTEAAEEIRAERGVGAEDLHLPPCRVEIVLGLSEENRLYVVLPTGAGLCLPFSCNAPFIQDPARFAIKDPSMSPTNRWLLQRTGRLAGKTMLECLGNSDLSLKERAEAYDLLTGATKFASGLDGTCSQIVMESMLTELKGQPLVLNTEGKLAKVGECAAVPAELYSVWESEQLLTLFAPTTQHLLAPEASRFISKLRSHGWINPIDSDAALKSLEQSENVPCPASWTRLHALWSFVQEKVQYDWGNERRRRMKVVPVDGSKFLHAANGVIRLSSRRDLLSGDDWKFVIDRASTANAEWLNWIVKFAPKKTPAGNEKTDPGYSLLHSLALHEPSSVDRIAAQASLRIFSGNGITIEDCVRMAHIMAALDASIPEGFRYVTRDNYLRGVDHGIVVDETGGIQDIVPETWANEHLLHEEYSRKFRSCTDAKWKLWVFSNKSKLHAFIPLTKRPKSLGWRDDLEAFLASREGSKPREYRYKNRRFVIEDYDFPPAIMQHWTAQAATNLKLWASVVKGLLFDPLREWEKCLNVTVRQISQQGGEDTLSCGSVLPAWLIHLRTVHCLTDVQGKPRNPHELLLRTPNTESLLGIELFVEAELDDSADKKKFLKLLGVRDTPANADKLLSRLHAMSGVPQPLQHLPQISRFYEALDRIVVRCALTELSPIKEAFNQKAIILTESGEWMSVCELSIFPDEDNGSPSIHPSLRNLALWPRVGVPERPALERTIEWLNSLESGTKLDIAASKRVRTALQRDPIRIWNECQHWLTLDSTWVSVVDLKYRLTMQALMKWGELFPAIKRATANLQMLSAEVAQLPSFAVMRSLGDAVEFRVTKFVQTPQPGGSNEWLTALALGLCRVKCSNDEETRRIRPVAQRLHQTKWNTFAHLDVTPYVDGEPAGEPFTPKVLWQDEKLYVASQPIVRLYKELADEIARPFDHNQIAEAIAACIARSPEFITEYLEAQFELDAQPELPTQSTTITKAGETDGEETRPSSAENGTEPESGGDLGPDAAEDSNDDVVDDNSDASDGGDHDDAGDSEGRDDDGDGQEQESTDEKEESKPPTPPKPTLIEIYAKQRGFRFHPTERCFTHPDGRWIEKSESPFNWEERAAGGELVTRIWVTDQKLAPGVEIAAELWALIGQQPDSTMMIVVGDDRAPCPLTGQELLELKNSRQITLHPARYRIVETN
jgi:hypothetical protein